MNHYETLLFTFKKKSINYKVNFLQVFFSIYQNQFKTLIKCVIIEYKIILNDFISVSHTCAKQSRKHVFAREIKPF